MSTNVESQAPSDNADVTVKRVESADPPRDVTNADVVEVKGISADAPDVERSL
jgi:hypothetical protein